MQLDKLQATTAVKHAAAHLEMLLARAENALAGKLAAHDRAVSDPLDDGFLPNFCNGWTVFNVAVIAEMLAIVIALVSPQLPISETMLGNLFMISLFIQWIALTSAAALCLTRKHLNRLSNLRAIAMSYLMLLCVTWIVGEATIWILWLVHVTGSPNPEWNAYFHLQNLTVAAIVNALALRYFFARHQLKQRTQSETQAKIQALRSRIRPHFLFNTMNVIASLTRSAPAQAETAIENMADLFRTMLTDEENLVPVKNEIAIAQKYLDIESLRLDSRLNVDWDIGKFPRKAVMPILTLQPILENAIQYCIEPLTEGGRIRVRLWEENDQINIKVTAPAPRAKARAQQQNEMNATLDNVRQRLESHYGKLAKLDTTEEAGQMTVSLILPIRGENP
jgi:two-component system, LytTR family, sensor histidine kinase AlgZ